MGGLFGSPDIPAPAAPVTPPPPAAPIEEAAFKPGADKAANTQDVLKKGKSKLKIPLTNMTTGSTATGVATL